MECFPDYTLLYERQISPLSLGGKKLPARSLMVSDLRLETKRSRFESRCYLCAEVRSLQQSPCLCLSVCEAGGCGSEELKKCPSPSPAVLWFVNGCERKPR